jgi:hypothetical protein
LATLASVTATPTTVAPGGTSRIVPIVTNQTSTANITLDLDGSTLPLQITVQEPLTFSVNAVDQGKPGVVVATVDQGGTLAVGPDGQSFVFTAS